MSKRRLGLGMDQDDSGSSGHSSPGSPMTKFRRVAVPAKAKNVVSRRSSIMSELLNFILDHEEAFKSRGRLASLYSDFSIHKTINPDGYDANINAWKRALAHAARAGIIPSQGDVNDLLTIRTGPELAAALQTHDFGRPTCLGTVIHDAVSSKEMIPLRDFLNAKSSIYNRSWIPSPWSILSWGLQHLGVLPDPSTPGKLSIGSFVVMENTEVAASSILKRMSSRKSTVDRVFSRETFLNDFAHVLDPTVALTPNDLEVLLKHLARDKQCISYDSNTVKFKASTDALPSPITEQDTTIAKLRDLIASLNAQISPLGARVAALDAEARSAVAIKSNTAARSALRSKKMTETTLAHRTDTLAQLEQVFSKIEQAADQVEIVNVMKSSASVLKGLHKEVGGVEGVEEVVDALKDEMGLVDEVSGVINEVGQTRVVVDEDELEKEFAALEQAEEEKREKEAAEKTAARLAEADKLKKERLGKEKAIEGHGETTRESATPDKMVNKASTSFSRLSVEELPAQEDAVGDTEEEDGEDEQVEANSKKVGVPVPA